MKGIQFDNAAQRKTYVGWVYEAGTKVIKERVLDELPGEFARLHTEGLIHIHDLDAYGQTYNCLQMDLLRSFPYGRFDGASTFRKITGIFDHFRDVIIKLGNEQSGGIGFPNFDLDLEVIFTEFDIPQTSENLQALRDSVEAFIDWCNYSRERCGQTTYYVSLNLGLATGQLGRHVTRSAIEYFRDSSLDVIKPNIIFKVKRGVNCAPSDPNYDLFQLALESSCKKMIPTYLLFDSAANAAYEPAKVAIMGCRTKVVADVYGEDRSVGRGNIGYVTINLPRIALEIDAQPTRRTAEQKLQQFKSRWTEVAETVVAILLHRYSDLLHMTADDFPCNQKFGLWVKDFDPEQSLEEVFRHGTLSIGFIGLSDAIEILTGDDFTRSSNAQRQGYELVEHMRCFVDIYREKHALNFTLLASSGEFISGRFPSIDADHFDHPVLEKGFYTNSFHVDVDSGLNPLEKIAVEGPFHVLANGGCISYVEFSAAPLANTEAVAEVVEAGIEHGVNYLGVNFPLDRCLDCGEQGTFDQCPRCRSKRIQRIRRVSGYLEDFEFFTPGKKAEVENRRPNSCVPFEVR